MYRNWIVRYYDSKDNIINTQKFHNRSESEAEREVNNYMPKNCKDWSLIPLIKKDSFKLAIDQESVNIFVDNGEDNEPTHVCYWHIEEVVENADVAISIANAINLYHSNPKELFALTYGDVEFED